MARYFVNPHVSRSAAAGDGIGRYWRATQTFSGWCNAGETYDSVKGQVTNGSMRFQVNLHLLAQRLGDQPPANVPLVPPISFTATHRDEPLAAPPPPAPELVQPFESTLSSVVAGVGVPIGPRLAAFLDDPLELGRPLGLSLPFLDPAATVSNTWFRDDDRDSAFHGGFDFSALPRRAGGLRPLMGVCAAAPGSVWMLLNDSGKGGGVVLKHEPEPGVVYATLYQHVLPASVKLAVGDVVQRGQKIGRIRRWLDGTTDRTHLHFNLIVRAPASTAVPRFWFAIDPFGVYDERSSGPNANYVPRERGGIREKIRGAQRVIHWAGDPPIRAFVGELTTDVRKIRRVQMRIRSTGGSESAQMLVWLQGETERYYLRLGADLDRRIEEQACALLRDAHAHGRPVQLAFRFRRDRKEISAVWVRAE